MNSHSPVLPTLTLLRQNFWVPRCRPLVSLLNRNCVTCRKLRPRAYQVPPPPPLPRERTRYERPFQTVGVDNTGAFTVLMEDGSESEPYITIFVCATTLAVHLEVSPTLTTRDFLLAFRRFCAICGTPAVILSDNGRNFIGAEACIAKLVVEEGEVQDHMRKLQIKWKFQTPCAPWNGGGGHFERLIAVVKSALAVALQRKTLQEEVFHTALAEAQAVVNNRPLTYLSNQLGEEPLTPSHLLRGHLVRMFPVVEQDVLQVLQPEPGTRARHQYQLLQQAITLFKKRWRDEYLMSLCQGHYNGCRVESQHHLHPRALVILVQNSQPKATWPLARILEVYPDEEEVIRTIKVKTEHGIFLRATNLVVPLELSCESYPPEGEIPEEALSEAEGPSTPQVGRISPTSPLRVDSPVPYGQRCDVIPAVGMSSETLSPPQSVSSRDSASTSGDQSQAANVVGPDPNSTLDEFSAAMGIQQADESNPSEVVVKRPKRKAVLKQRQLLQQLMDEDAL